MIIALTGPETKHKTRTDGYDKVIVFVLTAAFLTVLVIALSTTGGCSTIAQQLEGEIPAIVEPKTAVLEQDHCALEYQWCIEGVCVERIQEVTRFDLDLDDGTIISCTAVYLEMHWPDGSFNQWVWAGLDSDPKCESEMQRLAGAP
jgi:hypothetical protein